MDHPLPACPPQPTEGHVITTEPLGADDPDEAALDLSSRPDERAAATMGLASPEEADPPYDHVRDVALHLLRTFGVCLLTILALATLIAWFRPTALEDM